MKYYDVSNINVTAMQACIKVAQFGSFTRAAENMHISQSCLSKKISDLEMQMGIIIFIRGKNIEVRPTRAGKLLILRWEKIIAELQDAYIDAHELQMCKEDNIVIGLTHTTDETRLLSPIIKEFNQSNRDVDIRIEHNNLEMLLSGLKQGELDILFLPKCYYDKLDANRFEVYPFVENPLGICVSPESDLADVSEVSMKELRSKRFIVPRVLVPVLTSLCRVGDFTPDISYFTNDSWGQGSNLIHPDEVFIRSHFYIGSAPDKFHVVKINDISSMIYMVTSRNLYNDNVKKFKKACKKFDFSKITA